MALHAVLSSESVRERDEISAIMVPNIQRRNNLKQALWF